MTDLNIKLFLVDDDEIDAMSFERALKKSGIQYSLKHCKNASEALEEIVKDDYHCIFLDYQLPGVDGLVLLKRMKELGVHAPIAVLTSQGDEKIAVEMMKAGAFDYFPKAEVNADNITKIIRAGIRLNEIQLQKVEAERALKENNNKLNTILESTHAMIFSVDYDLKYTAFNTTFKKSIAN